MPAILTLVLLLTQAASLPVEHGNLAIQGTITDAMGRPFPGAWVWVKGEGSRLPRTTLSDVLGKYSLSNLLPGKYELFAEAPDFVKQQQAIDLTASTRVDMTMRFTETRTFAGGGLSTAQGDAEPPDPRIEATRKRRLSAERLISELWQFTLRREEMARTSEVDARLLRILNRIGELGTDAVAALILGLQDPDVQVRRNSGLILLDLSAKINISEALPSLRASLQDPDANVRDLASQAIAGNR